MAQRRMGVILGGVVLAVAAVAAPVHAQGPERGNRGGPGGGGPGGFMMGGRGGFGGFFGGGSLVDLARGEAVQKEIKVTEEQKPRIQDLSQQARSQRDRTMRQLRERTDRARSEVRNSRPATPPVAPPQANNGGGFGGDFGVGGYGSTPYGEIPQQGPSPAQLEQMAQMQQRQQEGMVRMQGFEQMRQAMQGLDRQSDLALAKILDKDQMTRLREIKLQMEGPFAILSNNELAQKLSVTPQQLAEIRDVSTKANESRRQDMMKRRNIFETIGNAMRQANAGAQPNANANPQDGNQGRGGRGNFDREAFRKIMEKPEVKAELDQIQQHENSLREQSYARVFKALDRRQSSTYKKMLGEPFDTNAMMRGFFTRGPGGEPDQPANAATTPKPADGDDGASPSIRSDAPAAAEAKPEAKEAPAPAPAPAGPRSSLRERRGGSSARP